MKKLLLPLLVTLFCYQVECNAQSSFSKIHSADDNRTWSPVTLSRNESVFSQDSKNNVAKIAANTISTSSITPFTYCKGAAVTVSFTISGSFNGDNVFTAQISDPSGTFTNPTTVGTLAGTSNGTINGMIPLTITNSGTYRIRVISSSPATNGTDNGTNLTINPLPTQYSITGSSSYCAEGNGVVIGVSNSEIGVKYQLKRDGANVGSELSGNFLPLSFGSQKTVGTYTVFATFTATGCTQRMSDSINLVVNPLPLQYNVTGGGSYCTGGSGNLVGLSNSQPGVAYQLLRYSIETGSPVGGTGDPISFGNQTVAGLYTVIAKNLQTGCSMEMPGNANIVINPLPTPYDVIGGGSYCDGENGVSILLYSSDTNIVYQLKVDGTNTGTPKNGTGLAIEFGLQKQPGTYTVEAVNSKTNCKSAMTGSKTIIRNPIPSKPVITKTGNELSSSANIGNQWYLNQQVIAKKTWNWDFGDTQTSTVQNPSHTFTNAGSYTVTLIVSDGATNDTITKGAFITVQEQSEVKANFSAISTSGKAPYPVKFTDLSIGSPTAWEWDFGDGSAYATVNNPEHIYMSAGKYSVTLTVTKDSKQYKTTKNDYITIDSTATAVEENTESDHMTDNKISLVPNPNDGISSVFYYSPFSQKVTLTMSSILGKQIFRKELEILNGENSIPLDVTGLDVAEGIYYITIQHSSGTVSGIMEVVK
ncbi:MAG: PKD domain-containing protein [Ignavibacteriae bacterium]|nr:PKD domain-containing protein [Ignavibacteriota bacterium]